MENPGPAEERAGAEEHREPKPLPRHGDAPRIPRFSNIHAAVRRARSGGLIKARIVNEHRSTVPRENQADEETVTR